MSGELDETADGRPPGAPKTTALVAGSFIGKYRLDRVLGEGGMGVVWAAHDPDLERAIAIKLLRYASAATELRQRLLREARAMAKLKHPNVLTVYEVGTVDDRDYIAMELVDGATLDTWFGHATYEERWHAVIAAGRGLAAAHAAGVVHRDFKPHNVLRSRDGRVLVTDFGLARGLLSEGDSAAIAEAPVTGKVTGLEETVAPRPSQRDLDPSKTPHRASDSVLDSPMTQTGALLGTPAYMAPEQYQGAPPDPRTDQFAFCVTAWQALTGERPFKGASLDELRTSASAGVEHVDAKLPGPIRAVLARGLDPDANKRWDSLEALLDALVRAGEIPARRRRIAYALFGLAMCGVLVAVQLARRGGDKTAEQLACAAPEQQFTEAWSPELERKVAALPGVREQAVARITSAFRQFRDRWVGSYGQTCKVKNAELRRAQLTCLAAVRDRASVFSTLVLSSPPQVVERIDLVGMLPNIKSCEGAKPLAQPLVPKDQPRRGRAIALFAKTFMLRGVPDDQLDATSTQLHAEAKQIGWDVLPGVIDLSVGNEYLRRGRRAEARVFITRALPVLKRGGDYQLEAVVRIDLLEASMTELDNPGAPVPPGVNDRHAKPVLHPELASLIAAARAAAGSDDQMLGSVALLEGMAYPDLGQWNRYRQAYDDALAKLVTARKHFEAVGDVRRVAGTFGREAEIYLMRGDERALDDANFAARQGEDLLDRAQLPTLPWLDDVRAEVAFARLEYGEVHRRLDRLAGARVAADGPTITGRVVGANGAPQASATVVAWRGELIGDRARVYSDARTVDGDYVKTGDDGTFTIHAAPGMAIIAEIKGARSKPQVIGAGSPTLKLAPTTTVSGTVTGRNLLGVRAFARFAVGNARFTVEAPVMRDETFDLAGLPPGTPVFGTTGRAGNAKRVVSAVPASTKLTWPYGQAVEVIARGKLDGGAQAYVLRGKLSAATRKDLDALAAKATDVATAALVPVGADNTDAGREVYRTGDRHAVITGNPDGAVTACAVATTAPDAPATCTTFDVKRTVEVDYPDGRFATGVTPIVLDLVINRAP